MLNTKKRHIRCLSVLIDAQNQRKSSSPIFLCVAHVMDGWKIHAMISPGEEQMCPQDIKYAMLCVYCIKTGSKDFNVQFRGFFVISTSIFLLQISLSSPHPVPFSLQQKSELTVVTKPKPLENNVAISSKCQRAPQDRERGGAVMHLTVLPGENNSRTLQSFVSDDEAAAEDRNPNPQKLSGIYRSMKTDGCTGWVF